MRAKHKKWKTLLCLLGIVLILAVLYICLGYRQQKKTRKADGVKLSSIDANKVVRMDYYNTFGKVSVVKKDGKWEKADDAAFPLQQEKIETMLQAVSNITATRKVIDKTQKLEQYGLQKPVIRIHAELEDGSTISLSIGDKAGVENDAQYYAYLTGQQGVYLLKEDIYTAFAISEADLMQMEATPLIEADQIRSVKIVKDGKPTFTLAYAPEKEKSADYYHWNIVKPYANIVKADTTAVSELLENYTTYAYLAYADYRGTDLEKYGLKNPKTLLEVAYQKENGSQKSRESYCLLIGNQNAEGDYYVQTKGSRGVYTMAQSTVDQLIHIKPYDYVLKDFSAISLDGVQTITIQEPNNTIKIEKKEEHYYLNGKKLDDKTFQKIYEAILEIRLQKEASDEKLKEQGKKLLQIQIKRKAPLETIELAYYTYDQNYDAVAVNGSTNFLVEKRAVKKLETILKQK